MSVPELSVVIPALDAAHTVADAIRSAPSAAEIVVVDGGSSDGTADAARAARPGGPPPRILFAPRGRAVQLNRGAAAAAAPTLLFLHADCRLPPSAPAEIRRVLDDPAVAGGWFPLRIEPGSPIRRLAGAGANRRARLLSLPYGDQAIFVRRSAFDRAGGYPDHPIMEDAGLARRLRRAGRLEPVNAAVTTGAGHWRRLGFLLTGLLDQLTLAAWAAGVPPERIAPIYTRLQRGSHSERNGPPTGEQA